MISIIVPVFNTEKYLRECIESILAQTYESFELILIDDGSTDHSWKICVEYQERDNRIKAFHKKNSGVSSARNLGLQKARGEYISFCDSDDVIVPNLYEILLKLLVQYDADRVCGGYEYIYPDGHQVFCKPRTADGLYQKKELLPVMIDDGTMSGFLFSGVNNSVFKKSIIDKYHLEFQESIKYNEDSLFSFEYALNSSSLYCLQSRSLYRYRQHKESSTSKRKPGDKYSELHRRLSGLDFDKETVQFKLQMQRRLVTEALWEILDIAENEKGIKAVKQIKNIVHRKNVCSNMKTLQMENMNRYKKAYYYMIKWKLAFLLYFVSKRLVPFFKKYISR